MAPPQPGKPSRRRPAIRLETPTPTALDLSMPGAEAALMAALDEIRFVVETDAILRRAVELARDQMGLRRAGIFILDRARNLARGTWGMDLSGAVVDQRDVVRELCATDLQALRRWESDGAYFTVFRNCRVVEHERGRPRTFRRGWIAKTPIRSTRGVLAMFVNDAGMTGDAVDEVKQAHVAVFCSILGTMLGPEYGLTWRPLSPRVSPRTLVASSIEMLEKDPTLGGKELAAALDVPLAQVSRVFKILMGVSLVEYRNRLRFDRFRDLIHRGTDSLLGAAMQAGFGSYAQFYRVCRARLHASPREYALRPRPAQIVTARP
jgi:AraC-like DNA-binding protein